MYKLLIVDDDPWVREFLADRIPWRDYGFEQVQTAVNGLQALRQIEADPPHILLTDIKMDGMNGIDLLIQVRENYPHIRVVLLSEYNEFEYARVAVKKGVVDYLLKPIEEKELTSLVQRTVKIIEQEQWNRERDQNIFRQLSLSLPLLKEKFIKDLILGGGGEAPPWWHFPDPQIDIDFAAFHIILIEIDNYDQWSGRPDNRTAPQLQAMLKQRVEIFLEQSGRAICFYENNRLVVVLSPRRFEITQDIRRLQETIRNGLQISVSIGISKLYNDQRSVCQAYLESFKALQGKFYWGRGLIAHGGDGTEFDTVDFLELIPREKIYNGLVSGNRERVSGLLAEFCQTIRAKRISYECLRIWHLRMVEILHEALEKSNIRPDHLFGNELEAGMKLDRFETLDDLQDWLQRVFLQGATLIIGKGNRPIRKLVDDAIRYLEDHLRENISLDDVAQKMYVHPAYLSRLFKEEVGKTFTHYLMGMRVGKAKELLKESYLKVYEISEQVGYANWKYFCRIFKDIEGVTPMEYRDRIPKIRPEGPSEKA